tara:strand:- start:182 stop:340 length:159 start_codon:yes stop_codon:yes gene_type:complete
MSNVEPTQEVAETAKKASKRFLTTNSILAANMFLLSTTYENLDEFVMSVISF